MTELEMLESEYNAIVARMDEMRETLVGCDWCCGGGDEEWEALDKRLA